MDENYARRLRDWLQAEPGATASEERRWLREIPDPTRDERAAQTGQPLHGDRPAEVWPVYGERAAETWPVRDHRADGRRPVGGPSAGQERPTRADQPDEVRPERGHHPASAVNEQPAPDQGAVNGQLPEADEDWVCPVITLPVPRVSAENGCRMSEAEAHNRRPMSEAEARSRWNHPSSWHRRRRAEDLRRRDEPGSH
jgi:hypothetical protein